MTIREIVNFVIDYPLDKAIDLAILILGNRELHKAIAFGSFLAISIYIFNYWLDNSSKKWGAREKIYINIIFYLSLIIVESIITLVIM